MQGKSLFAPKKSGHKKEIRTLAFSPSGNTLISGSQDVSDNKDFKTVKDLGSIKFRNKIDQDFT
jgi:WD40 repeat protein